MFRDFLLSRKRRRAAAHTQNKCMQRFLQTPLPSRTTPARLSRYLVADLEMSGLDPTSDHILSIGWVMIENNQILNGTAQHRLIQHSGIDLQQTAPIHHLSNTQLQSGQPLADVLDEFLNCLAGCVLVLHHATLDLAFLNVACRSLYGTELLIPVIDTFARERVILSRRDQAHGDALRLHACRRRYNLPDYSAHNAVIDAIATAELWLAQLAHSSQNDQQTLGSYLTH